MLLAMPSQDGAAMIAPSEAFSFHFRGVQQIGIIIAADSSPHGESAVGLPRATESNVAVTSVLRARRSTSPGRHRKYRHENS